MSGAQYDQESMDRAAEALRSPRGTVVLTGAGISVESGIPPFRGPGGIWNKYDPEVLDLHFFQRDPERSWAAIREMFTCFLGTADQTPVLPNAAHQVLGCSVEFPPFPQQVPQPNESLPHRVERTPPMMGLIEDTPKAFGRLVKLSLHHPQPGQVIGNHE